MLNSDRIAAAYQVAKDDLLGQRCAAGHWIGELSTSALSTATAVSALALALKNGSSSSSEDAPMIEAGVHYLLQHQNDDGGWGDTEKSYSNIATTMLAVAAMTITGDAQKHPSVLSNAENYIQKQGGIAGLRRRYGRDKTFAVPILTNYALAGRVDWKEVSPLPFEAAVLPQSFYKFIQLPVVSYAIPALVAIGQARFFHRKPLNPFSRTVRNLTFNRATSVLNKMQPDSGGYLEAIPLTSFVVMSLASSGRAEHDVTQNGLRFIRDSVREDGSWPIDTNLATWVTTLSVNALSLAESDREHLDRQTLDWILQCQTNTVHPFTGAAPGAWGWTDLSGSVPDADDTPGALLALRNFYDQANLTDGDRFKIEKAAQAGCGWLLDLQNSDGGWPTFCRGWGTQPFDRSGSDLTAHALRALHAWREIIAKPPLARGVQNGVAYLRKKQRADGSWLPLWFGNQDATDEENPIYGTVKVLLALRDLDLTSDPMCTKGTAWLADQQNADGGFGGGPASQKMCGLRHKSSNEETGLAIEGLLVDNKWQSNPAAFQKAADWLCSRVEDSSYRVPSPIGFYFSKLWYYEKLYPRIMMVSALASLLAVSRHQTLTRVSAEAE